MWSPNDEVWSPKWGNEESNFWHSYTVLHLERWLTHSGDLHCQFCPFIFSDLAYITYDVFCVKIYL